LHEFSKIKDRVIIINGLSKGYAMTGYRLGYIAAQADVAQRPVKNCRDNLPVEPMRLHNVPLLPPCSLTWEPTKEMVDEFERRRQRVMELLKEIPGIDAQYRMEHSIFSHYKIILWKK
jgi:aspartate aminotransferase